MHNPHTKAYAVGCQLRARRSRIMIVDRLGAAVFRTETVAITSVDRQSETLTPQVILRRTGSGGMGDCR
jgi:hypothetical protein